MGLTAFQPFTPTGTDGQYVSFSTPSWTGGKEDYEVSFEIDAATVRCSCMDATCRRKNGLPVTDKGLCKHATLASRLFWPVIAKAVGRPS